MGEVVGFRTYGALCEGVRDFMVHAPNLEKRANSFGLTTRTLLNLVPSSEDPNWEDKGYLRLKEAQPRVPYGIILPDGSVYTLTNLFNYFDRLRDLHAKITATICQLQ